MAKQKGVKHHVVIKLEDLNKMFQPQDVVPVPKGFLKSIEYLLSAHNVNISEVDKDTSSVPFAEKEQASSESAAEPTVGFQVTDFNG